MVQSEVSAIHLDAPMSTWSDSEGPKMEDLRSGVGKQEIFVPDTQYPLFEKNMALNCAFHPRTCRKIASIVKAGTVQVKMGNFVHVPHTAAWKTLGLW